MSILQKLERIDRRYIFLIGFILVAVPTVLPLGLPLPISPYTTAVYQQVEKMPAGSVVMMSFDYGPSGAAELIPQNIAIMRHMILRGVKGVFVTFSVDGPGVIEKAVKDSGMDVKYKYGEGYVHLGYIAGIESGMASFAANTWVVGRDYYGNPVDTLPIMQNVKTIRDFGLIAFTTATSQDHYIRQWSGKGVPVAGLIQSYYFSVIKTYLQAGQIIGFVNGLRGAAEYETLLKAPGTALSTMDATSLTHLFGVALVVIANIGYFASKRRK